MKVEMMIGTRLFSVRELIAKLQDMVDDGFREFTEEEILRFLDFNYKCMSNDNPIVIKHGRI